MFRVGVPPIDILPIGLQHKNAPSSFELRPSQSKKTRLLSYSHFEHHRGEHGRSHRQSSLHRSHQTRQSQRFLSTIEQLRNVWKVSDNVPTPFIAALESTTRNDRTWRRNVPTLLLRKREPPQEIRRRQCVLKSKSKVNSPVRCDTNGYYQYVRASGTKGGTTTKSYFVSSIWFSTILQRSGIMSSSFDSFRCQRKCEREGVDTMCARKSERLKRITMSR